MAQKLIDVVALAAQLGQPADRDQLPGIAAGSVPPASQSCPLGHLNAAGTRYCAECGLEVGDSSWTPRVDLEAVRDVVRPAAVLDGDERARRDREHAEAMAANQRMEQEVQDSHHDPSSRKVMVHFVADGFSFFGRVHYAGEEFEAGPEHPRWGEIVRWIRLSKAEQVARYGRVYFDHGPWPGRALPQGADQSVLLPTAGVSQWAAMRGGVPASQSGDGSGALIPR